MPPGRPRRTAAISSPGCPRGRPRRAASPILLCAHLDTVPVAGPIEPVIVDGGWENAGPGILGADNKAAIAVILALARRAAREGLPVELELLFTVSRSEAWPARAPSTCPGCAASCGYVFDHASPIGEVIVASPHHYRLEAVFHGAAAHAGIAPEGAAARSPPPRGRWPPCGLGASTRRPPPTWARSPGAPRSTWCPTGARRRRGALPRRRTRRGGRGRARRPRARRGEPARVRVRRGRRRSSGCSPATACRPRPRRARGPAGAARLRLRATQRRQRRRLGCQRPPGARAAVVNLANGTERNHEPGERVSVTRCAGRDARCAPLASSTRWRTMSALRRRPRPPVRPPHALGHARCPRAC